MKRRSARRRNICDLRAKKRGLPTPRVAYLQNARANLEAEQNGDGSSLRETQEASALEVAAHLASQKEKAQGLKEMEATLLDTPSEGAIQETQMAWENA